MSKGRWDEFTDEEIRELFAALWSSYKRGNADIGNPLRASVQDEADRRGISKDGRLT